MKIAFFKILSYIAFWIDVIIWIIAWVNLLILTPVVYILHFFFE